MANTIKIKKWVDIIEEFIAHEAITPGMLVEQISTGKVQKHASEDGIVLPMFVLEDELQGETITDDIDADAPAQVWIPQRGEVVYALLKEDENVAIGALLSSKGDGTLKEFTEDSSTGEVYPGQVVGVATEAVNASGGNVRIKVRIF